MKLSVYPIIRWMFYLLLLGLPWGFVLSLSPKSSIHLWLADFILTFALVGLLVRNIFRNRRVLTPPIGIQILCLSVLTCIILSPSGSWTGAGQLVVYTYGSWLLVSQVQMRKERHRAFFFIFIFHLSILSGIGCYQVLSLHSPNYLVRAILPNYHVLSAFLILCFLYVFPILLIQRSKPYAILSVLLSLGLFLCLKSPPSMIALTLGLLAQVILIAYFHVGWKNSRLILSSLAGMLLLALGILIQPTNLKEIAEYLHPYEPPNIDLQYSRIQTILNLPQQEIRFANAKIKLVDPFIHELEVKPWRRYDELNNQHLVSQRLVERIIALNMAQMNPASGVGIGKYQDAKDYFFGSVIKVNTTEPYSYSSLATTLGTGGIILLIGILAFLSGQVYNIGRNFQMGQSRRAMLIGAFGSAVAFVSLAYQIDVFIAPTLVLFTILSTLSVQDFSGDIEKEILGVA